MTAKIIKKLIKENIYLLELATGTCSHNNQADYEKAKKLIFALRKYAGMDK